VQVALAAPVLRIVNNLYAGTNIYGNWGLLNNIIRVRIGPSDNAVFTNSVYERLHPYNSTASVENTLQISPGGSKDFNVTTTYSSRPATGNPRGISMEPGGGKSISLQ
jgi:hypothetical protein